MKDEMIKELDAWRRRFPTHEYRPQDDGVFLRLSEVKYGCHVDLEEGMEPDECVLDCGNINDCVYTRSVKIKEQCQYWQPIKVT